MKKQQVGYFLFSLILLPVVAVAAPKERQADIDSSQDDGWISNGASLGVSWWKMNPKKLDVIPDPLLYHTELSYSYSDSSGNTENEFHEGIGQLFLRKNLLTSDTTFKVYKMETVMSLEGDITRFIEEKQAFFQEFRLAVSPSLEVIAGLNAVENNSLKFIDHRINYYAGIGGTFVDTPSFSLGGKVAYGLRETSYINENVSRPILYSIPPVDDYDSDIISIQADFDWKITEMVSFSEFAWYRVNLEDTEYYSLDLTTQLNFNLSDYFSLFIKHEFMFENNTFVESVQDVLDARRAQGENVGAIDDTDTRLSMGITLKF